MRADGGFTAFVVAHEAALLRTAFLLTGDRGAAEDLVLEALVRARRRWWLVRRAGAPGARVRELLVRCSLRRRRRSWRGGQVLGEPPEVPGTHLDDGLDRLAAELDRLPRRARAVLVLRVAEGVPEGTTARVVGSPVDAVRLDADRALAAVRGVLSRTPVPPPAPPPGDADVADALRRLAARAGPPHGTGTADAALALLRRQVSAVAARAGGALVVAGLLLAGPALVPGTGPVPDRTVVVQRPPPAAALTALPTRGSLAGDEAFLAGVAARDWSAVPGEGPSRADRHVVFAGDLPGGRRWALVAAHDGGQLLHAWFGGPAGAAPGELALVAGPERTGSATTLALLDPGGPAPLLVVVTRPGEGARYSPGSVRLGDGSLGRRWTALSVTGGVLVGEVPEPLYPGSEVVELVREDSTSALRYLPRTDGSVAPDGWALAHPVDAALTADPAVRERLAACLGPRGLVVHSGADGVTYTHPTDTGLRSDEELVQLHAHWDAVVAECLAVARTGG